MTRTKVVSGARYSRYGWGWGPFEIERTTHVPGRGWVLTVRCGSSDERVEITTSEKGRSGMKVRHVMWSSASQDKEELHV
jgi:hypothetical protein